MNSIALLREQLQSAHGYLEGTMADVADEQLHWTPPGRANSVGASYAHLVTSEDMIVHGMMQGVAPLFAVAWAGRTGLSEPMPTPGPGWEQYGEWARRVRVEIGALRQYAQAVYEASDTYLAGLSEADLDRTFDLSAVGLGQRTLGWMIGRLLIGHADNLCGEIAALKGCQGLQGYPE
jgi:hypothetical protein